MASHHQPDNVTPLHRGVRPIPREHIESIFGEPAETFQMNSDEDLLEEPVFTVSEMIVACFVCGMLGCLLTATLAYVWSFYL